MSKLITSVLLGAVLLITGFVFAQGSPIDVGNKICPVSGNPIGAMGPGVVHEYNGKIYHFCCPGCPKLFDKNPAKYAKIAEDQAAGK